MIRLFGSTISETFHVLAKSGRAHAGPGEREEGETQPRDKAKAIVRIVLSLLLIFLGTYFIVAPIGTSQEIGSAILGIVAGYWFK